MLYEIEKTVIKRLIDEHSFTAREAIQAIKDYGCLSVIEEYDLCSYF